MPYPSSFISLTKRSTSGAQRLRSMLDCVARTTGHHHDSRVRELDANLAAGMRQQQRARRSGRTEPRLTSGFCSGSAGFCGSRMWLYECTSNTQKAPNSRDSSAKNQTRERERERELGCGKLTISAPTQRVQQRHAQRAQTGNKTERTTRTRNAKRYAKVEFHLCRSPPRIRSRHRTAAASGPARPQGVPLIPSTPDAQRARCTEIENSNRWQSDWAELNRGIAE